MTKEKAKKLLDYIPVLILTAFAANLIWTRVSGGPILKWQHWLALFLLLANYFIFTKNHQAGVLMLGLTLIIGMFGIAQFSPGVSSFTLYWAPFNTKILLFYGQPIFLLWFILHFILSGRFYTAIATKKYWTEFLSNFKETTPI